MNHIGRRLISVVTNRATLLLNISWHEAFCAQLKLLLQSIVVGSQLVNRVTILSSMACNLLWAAASRHDMIGKVAHLLLHL